MKLSSLAPVFIFTLGTLTACGGGSDSPEPLNKDTIAPVITLNGDSTLTHSVGTDYADQGATANDATDGTLSVTITGTVDSNVVSSYTLTYSATDAAGNKNSITRTVEVLDLTGPVITPTGGDSITHAVSHNLGDVYTDLGATGKDNIDESVTITTSGEVNSAQMGSYTITYTATDEAGNETSSTRTVKVEDLAGPVITPTGGDSITHAVSHNLGDVYTDLGATGIDNVDETVTIITSGEVNVNVLGSYIITYTATDALEHTTSQTRTVTVEDLAGPVITLTGGNSTNHNFGDTYEDQGAMGSDNSDETVTIITTGAVNYAEMGTYTITYTATDAAGNETSIDRTVIVADFAAPVITLNGDATVNHNYGDDYADSGATAADNFDTSITVTTTGGINVDQINSYTITYTATDAAGNEATPVERTVNVADIVGPVITLTGGNTLTLGKGRLYKEQGATGVDNLDGVVVVGDPIGTVDYNTIGQYELTYSVTDAANNVSTQVRTVDVVTPKPFITTWKTDNTGFSDDFTIKIGTDSSTHIGVYNYSVDWGDGNISNETGDASHTYAEIGTYTVTIEGDFPQIFFDYDHLATHDNAKLLTIEQWGDGQWLSMHYAFAFCSNLVVNAIDTPIMNNVTTMEAMFYGAVEFNSYVNNWDVSSVTNMKFLFSAAKGVGKFNQALSSWDLSSVTDTHGMLSGAEEFNQDISMWDVSSVVTMTAMFHDAKAFNQDISNWDVRNVTDMTSLFYNATSFEQDISSWNVSLVEKMEGMFKYVTLSTANYDALLNGWAGQNLKGNVNFHGGNSLYSPSSQAARDTLTSAPNSWSITDGGAVP